MAALISGIATYIAQSNDGTKTTLLGPAGDYTRIGDATTTSQSLASNDDQLVTGKLEVDGMFYGDGGVTA